MDLGGNSLEGTKQQFSQAKAVEQQEEEGDAVHVIFQLQDGSKQETDFKMGHTVAFVKMQIEDAAGIPMAKQKLTLAGKTLIDPLSLADCPGIKPGCTCTIDVAEA
eukprot:jgi/Chrzof1/11125/Cz05g24200.t1